MATVDSFIALKLEIVLSDVPTPILISVDEAQLADWQGKIATYNSFRSVAVEPLGMAAGRDAFDSAQVEMARYFWEALGRQAP